MKHISFFITHKTLGIEHCELVFKSIASQKTAQKFDKLYIYNTHKDELSNNQILDMYDRYDLDKRYAEYEIFDYNPSTHKSLGGDISAIASYCDRTYNPKDRILLHKSDCLLSKNYFDDIFQLPPGLPLYFTAPFICAKERVPNEEILNYIDRDSCVLSDNVTFFVEDRHRSNNTDFFVRKDGVSVISEQIKFTSCTVIRDFSCHLISNELLKRLHITNQSWGGVNLSALEPYFAGTERSFVVHKFHDIVSENRATGREGPVAEWLSS
jgi:hypothetical protein